MTTRTPATTTLLETIGAGERDDVHVPNRQINTVTCNPKWTVLFWNIQWQARGPPHVQLMQWRSK
jgi:hypothetical protein